MKPSSIDRLRTVVLIAFALVPFVAHRSVQEHIYLRVTYLLVLATLVWSIFAVRALGSAWLPPRPLLVVPCAIWLGASALSVHWARVPALVPVAVFRDFSLLAAAGAFAIVAASRRGRALAILGAGAGVALAWALGDHVFSDTPEAWRPFYQSSLAAGFAATVLAASVGALAAGSSTDDPEPGRRTVVIGCIALALLAATVLVTTQAMTAAGSALAGAVSGILATRGLRGRWLASLAPVAALAVGLGILFYAGHALAHPSASVRLLLWEGALAMLRDAPLGGIGYGGFGAVFPEYRPAGYWETLYASAWSPHAHSLYLELAAELGLLGLGLGIGFVVIAMRGSLRLAKSATTTSTRRVAGAITGALSAIAVVAIADLTADYPLGRFLFFALAGLAHTRTAAEETSRGRPPDALVRRGLYVGVALALILQCLLVEPGLVASRIAYRRGDRLLDQAQHLMVRREANLREGRGIEDLDRTVASLLDQARSNFEDAAFLPHFETEWTMRARLQAAITISQRTALGDLSEDDAFALVHRGMTMAAQVEEIAPDFEDGRFIYALLALNQGDQLGFEEQLRAYLERRLVWDLRANLPTQRGPTLAAWRVIAKEVPPTSPLWQWLAAELARRPASTEPRRADEALLEERAAAAAFGLPPR